MAKRVTLADIARHTGLSAATVSMALNDRPDSRIPERTAGRVRAAVSAATVQASSVELTARTAFEPAVGAPEASSVDAVFSAQPDSASIATRPIAALP